MTYYSDSVYEEDLMSEQTCKMLKELGFNELLYHYYKDGKVKTYLDHNSHKVVPISNKGLGNYCSVITAYELKKYYDKHDDVAFIVNASYNGERKIYAYKIYTKDFGVDTLSSVYIYNSYEAALKAALEYYVELQYNEHLKYKAKEDSIPYLTFENAKSFNRLLINKKIDNVKFDSSYTNKGLFKLGDSTSDIPVMQLNECLKFFRKKFDIYTAIIPNVDYYTCIIKEKLFTKDNDIGEIYNHDRYDSYETCQNIMIDYIISHLNNK